MTRLSWISGGGALTQKRQCTLAGVARATVYANRKPVLIVEIDVLLKRLIDEEYTRHPRVRHQMTQVVDLYRGAFKTLHYKRLIWGSREGFLMLNADRICECSCVMVDKPLSGADLFKTIF